MGYNSIKNADQINVSGGGVLLVWLTAALASILTGAVVVTPGWYDLGFLNGGDYEVTTSSEDDKDETGSETGKVVYKDNHAVIRNTLKQTSTALIRVIRRLQKSHTDYLYIAPIDELDADSDEQVQVLVVPNARITSNLKADGYKDGEKRTIPIEITSKDRLDKRAVDGVKEITDPFVLLSLKADGSNWGVSGAPAAGEGDYDFQVRWYGAFVALRTMPGGGTLAAAVPA